MQDKIDKQAALKTAGFAAWARTIVVKYALRYKKKIKAPAVITTPTADVSYETVKQDWEQDRQRLSQFLEKLPEAAKDKEIFRHPIVGMMNIYHTLAFMREHVLHHIAQVKRLETASKK